jgi:DnaJ like chaperone protein
MGNLIILIIVGVVFYMLNKNYKSSDFQHIDIDKKQAFDGDLNNHEAGLLISMLAKVAKAD